MLETVIKRDGRIVEFDAEKIRKAVALAMQRTKKGVDEEIIEKIIDYVESKNVKQLSVEEIHDIVEKRLMSSTRKDAAREYVKERHRRDVARQSKTKVMFDEIVATKANDITRENANMNADTPAGMMMKFASETTKTFVDNYLISEDVKEYVDNNIVHIHDKDYYPTKSLTCIQHPLDRIFENGFRAGHGESRAPKRIETAAIIACISMETVQNEMHGGQAIPAFDFYLAPYVRATYKEEIDKISALHGIDHSNLKDAEIDDYIVKSLDGLSGDERWKQHAINETVNRVHQAMEAFIHNMNQIHSRGGNQVVFSSVNYGTDTSAEGRCVIREILNSTYEGVGNGSTAIFPIQIWKKKRGVSYLPEDPNYDLYKLACKVSARRFFPNFLNLDASYNVDPLWDKNDPKRYVHEVATMGCRTRVYGNRFGEYPTSIGRGNLSFTTINLPKLAIEAALATASLYEKDGKIVSIYDEHSVSDVLEKDIQRETISLFFDELNKALDIVAKQLDERYQFQSTAKAKQFPLLMSGLWNGSDKLDPEDTIEPVIKHGTLGVGFIGLAETLVALVGKHHGESEYAQKLGLEIVSLIDKRCKEFSEKYNHNYSCFATPAEGLSGKFTKVDKKEYGEIKGVTDKDYYTNSNHVPVWYHCSAKHKAEVEAPYHKITPAGHIFYVELDGELEKNPEAVMNIVDLMDKYDIGYGSFNHNVARCDHCCHESVKEFPVDENGEKYCPVCGSKNVSVLQRITGYLVSTVDRWNSGKQAEFKDRIQHEVQK